MLMVLRPVAVAVGLLDRPGGHKRHRGNIPVIGGIAIFCGVAVAALMTDGLGQHGVMLLVTSAMLVGLGVVDDRFDLPASARLMGHLTAAMLLVSGSGYQVTSLGDLFGVGALSLGLLAWPFTVVAGLARSALVTRPVAVKLDVTVRPETLGEVSRTILPVPVTAFESVTPP